MGQGATEEAATVVTSADEPASCAKNDGATKGSRISPVVGAVGSGGSPIPSWSYSSINLFKQCGRKYFHLRVAKDFKEPESEALIYGNELHKAAENYIQKGEPLEGRFQFIKPYLDQLNGLPGAKYCEYRMGLTQDLEPCEFFGKGVWWRGIADFLSIHGTTAYLIDYKTGKSKYVTNEQLEITSLAIFKHFPYVQRIRAGYLFVVAGEFNRAEFKREAEPELWTRWLREIQRLEGAYTTRVWNASPSGLCQKYCVVTSCEHNGRNR